MSNVKIEIDGNDYSNLALSFELSQSTYGHHFFHLEIRTDSIQNNNQDFLSSGTFDLIGKDFVLAWLRNFSLVDDNIDDFIFFKGIVTGVSTKRSNASKGIIIIEGKSPTTLMDDGSHCRSFEHTTLSNIVRRVIADYPVNMFKEVKNKPIDDVERDYVVQYNESSFQFLNKLATRHGEWLYYDGKNYVFGHKESGEDDILLTFDQDLKEFGVSTQTISPNFAYLSRDYINDTTQIINTADVQSEKMGELGERVYNNLSKLFHKDTNVHNNSSLSENKEKELMQNLAKKDKAAIVANLVTFRGQSDNFSIKPGTCFTIQNSIGVPILDKYYITSVTHSWSKNAGYINNFTAIEAKVEVSPYSNLHDFPVSYPQSATVIDNQDPLGIGRVKIQLEWQTNEDAFPWVRMSQPHSGGEKGFYFIPEIGEEVIVGFEGGNAEKPYISGTYHHTGHPSPDNDPNQKIIKTRSGNTVHLNDNEGSIRIEDPSGNTWFMDGQGNVSLTAPNDITMNVGNNMTVNVGNDMTFNVGNQALLNIMQQMLVKTPAYQQLVSGLFHSQSGNALINTLQDLKLESPKLYAAASEELMLHGEQVATLNSPVEATMHGGRAVKTTNSPRDYTPADPIGTKCVVHFRPPKNWKGKGYGFDWFRTGDTDMKNDIPFEKIISKQYYKGSVINNKTEIPGVSDVSHYYDGDYNRPDKEMMKRLVNQNYSPSYKIPWQTNPLKNAYYSPWLSLYSPKSNPHGVNSVAELDIIIDCADKPDVLKFESNSNFEISPMQLRVSRVGETKMKRAVKIKCLKSFSKAQQIKLYAYKSGVKDATPSGIINVYPNNKRILKKILLHLVKIQLDSRIDVGVMKSEEEEILRNTFRHAQIEIEIIPTVYEINNTTHADFFNHFFDRGKLYFNPVISHAKYRNINEYLHKKKPVKNGFINGFLFGNRCHVSSTEKRFFGGVASPHQDNFSFYGKNRNDFFCAHEALHIFKIPHPFLNSEVISGERNLATFDFANTDNVADYPHYIAKNQAFSTWKWQWDIMRTK